MLSAVQGETGNGWKKVKAVAEQFAVSNEKRLKMIADLRISGEIDDKEFEKAINDEKDMLEAQMNALVISKAIVQKVVISIISLQKFKFNAFCSKHAYTLKVLY